MLTILHYDQSTTQNVENYCFIFLDDITLDRVKSRRGRPKRTKKPFWNFSKQKRKATKKVEKCKLKVENLKKTNQSRETGLWSK